MKKAAGLLLVALLIMAGCSGGSGSSSSAASGSGGGGSSVQAVNIVGSWQMLWTSTENPGDFLILEANLSQQSDSSFFSAVPNTIVIPAVSSAQGSTPISYQGTKMVLFSLGEPCWGGYANSVNMESATITFSSATQASFSVTANEPSGSEPQGTYATGTLTFDSTGKTASGHYSISATGCNPSSDSGTISASLVSRFSGNYILPSNSNATMGPPPPGTTANWAITYPTQWPSGACQQTSSSDSPSCLEIAGPWWDLSLNEGPYDASWFNQQTGGAFVAGEFQQVYPNYVPVSLFGLYDPPPKGSGGIWLYWPDGCSGTCIPQTSFVGQLSPQ